MLNAPKGITHTDSGLYFISNYWTQKDKCQKVSGILRKGKQINEYIYTLPTHFEIDDERQQQF